MSPFGENDSLFTTTFIVLYWKLSGERLTGLAHKVYRTKLIAHKEFRDSHTSREPWSDDNHIGMLCLNQVMKQVNPNVWSIHHTFFYRYWWRRIQPKHLIFFLYACPWTRVLSLPFLWIMSLWFMGTCLNESLNKNTKELDTDGKILVWLILSCYKLPTTQKLCTWAIRRNKRAGSWEKLFKIYYKNLRHPNRNFPKLPYELFHMFK